MTPHRSWTADMAASVFTSLALLVLLPGAAAGQADRTVAITIDDLPYVGGPQELAAARNVAEGILAALDEAGAPARGFVTGSRVVVEDQVDERIALLRRWRSAGVGLENHSCCTARSRRRRSPPTRMTWPGAVCSRTS